MIAPESLSDKVLQMLASIAETEEVCKSLDLPLYDLQILDSMKTVELIVAIGQQFGVKISPAEFEREQWATPRKLIADLERRLT
jgi:D-alanine--poly(phosphoribitol) ligase subunit 2